MIRIAIITTQQRCRRVGVNSTALRCHGRGHALRRSCAVGGGMLGGAERSLLSAGGALLSRLVEALLSLFVLSSSST